MLIHFCHNLMKYIIIALVILVVRASLELSSFNVNPHATVIHQINGTMVMIGNEGGWIRLYAIKNGQMLREEYYHKGRVVSIQNYVMNNVNFVITADTSGLIAIWNENIVLQKSFDVKMAVQTVCVNTESGTGIIMINTGSQIHFYDIGDFAFITSIKAKGKIIKSQLTNSNLYLLQQNEGASSIILYNHSQYNQVLNMGYKIHDFAIYDFNQTLLVYLIDNSSHLTIYQLDKNYSVINFANQQGNKMFPSNYTSILYFQNQQELPMFTIVKQNAKIQFYLGFQVLMFLQFNYQIKKIESNIKNYLVFIGSNNRVTVVTMKDTDQSKDIWIILLILLLLALSLYLCFRDCCPGVYQKWKQGKQRKQIEMALYKQKSQLDNF